MAKKKTTKKTASRKPKAKAKTQKADKKLLGRTLGLNIRQTWMRLFADNEKAKKKDRKTDTQIAAFMRAEFPGRTPKDFTVTGVASVRCVYNHGWWNPQPPAIQSSQYDADGNAVPVQRGPKPKAAEQPASKPKGVRVRRSA